MITFFFTTAWGIAYLVVGAIVGVLAAREMYYSIAFVSEPINAAEDAIYRDVVFFIVLRCFAVAGALWPLTVIVHIINRVAAQWFADSSTAPLGRDEAKGSGRDEPDEMETPRRA